MVKKRGTGEITDGIAGRGRGFLKIWQIGCNRGMIRFYENE